MPKKSAVLVTIKGEGELTTQETYLDRIKENKSVRLFLPLKTQEERKLTHCVLEKIDTNHFLLHFKGESLPTADIDTNTTCLVNLDDAGQSISLECNIVDIVSPQLLKMIIGKTISHEQMREYFRADIAVPILLRSTVPEAFNTQNESWRISGTTVDLSGSGLRASFTQAPPLKTQVRIEIALPTADTTIIKTLATPVRVSKLTETLWDAAYHFDDITIEDQDTLIGCCLVAQRRLLRLKVQVKNKQMG